MKDNKINYRFNKEKRRNRIVVVAALLAAVVICCICFYFMHSVSVKNNEQSIKIASLEKELEHEKQRSEDLKTLRERINSKEYMEEIAREKFNLAYPDDYVFVPND